MDSVNLWPIGDIIINVLGQYIISFCNGQSGGEGYILPITACSTKFYKMCFFISELDHVDSDSLGKDHLKWWFIVFVLLNIKGSC